MLIAQIKLSVLHNGRTELCVKIKSLAAKPTTHCIDKNNHNVYVSPSLPYALAKEFLNQLKAMIESDHAAYEVSNT